MNAQSGGHACASDPPTSVSLHRIKDRLLAQIGHDVRNMASAVSSAVQLAEVSGSMDHLRKAQRGLNAQVIECVLAIENVLEFTKLLSEREPDPRERVALSTALEQAVKAARPVFETREQTVEVIDNGGAIEVEASDQQIDRSVLNLLLTASRCASRDTVLRLICSVDRGEAVIAVEFSVDRHAEPPPTVAECLIELEGNPEMGYSPALAVCVTRAAVERDGGALAFRDPGTGICSYELRLPATPVLSDGLHHHAGLPRVLAVDDDADTVASLAELLRLSGYDARTAIDGPSALEVAQEFRPHVVVLDLALPHMDGFEVAAQLRKHAEFQDTLIVAVSGHGDAETVERVTQAGIDFHFLKPMDTAQLLQVIQQSVRAEPPV